MISHRFLIIKAIISNVMFFSSVILYSVALSTFCGVSTAIKVHALRMLNYLQVPGIGTTSSR